MGHMFDKYSWPLVSQGLTFEATYRSRGYSDSPLVLLALPDDVKSAVREVLEGDDDAQAEVYAVKIDGQEQPCVFKSTARQSPDKELLYPADAQAIIGACIEPAVQVAALSPLRMAWRNVSGRFPMVVMPPFGLFLLITGAWMSHSIFFSPTHPNEQTLLVVTIPYTVLGLPAVVYPFATGYWERWKVRRALSHSILHSV